MFTLLPMILVLDETMALEFFRSVYPADRRPTSFCDLPKQAEYACNDADIWQMAPEWITPAFLESARAPLSCLVPTLSKRRESKTHHAHLKSSPIPPHSFNDLGNGVFVPSPCFTFLQMAKRLSIVELIALGDELCGTYSFDIHAQSGFRQRSEALTTKDQLDSYVAKAERTSGVRKARRALKYIVDGSASPMETYDEMLLCLPNLLGGYGLPAPVMNKEIVLDPDAARMARKSVCYADLCWPDRRLIAEHQGLRYHTDASRYAADRARTSALQAMGYKVFELTALRMTDPDALKDVARQIARELGWRLKENVARRSPQRESLMSSLERWNSAYGRIADMR